MKKFFTCLINFISLRQVKTSMGFTNFKVKTILIVSFLFIGIIPLIIVSYFTYQGARNTLEQKVGFYSKEIAEQVANKINNKLIEIDKSSIAISTNVEINELLSKTYDNSFERMIARDTIVDKIGLYLLFQ